MYNFHPPMAAFPVALFTLVLILEIVSFFYKSTIIQNAILVNLVAAGFFLILAFISGFQGLEFVQTGVAEDEISYHHLIAKITCFLSILPVSLGVFSRFCTSDNKLLLKALYYVLLVICTALVLYVGYLGASIVFQHGAGVHTL